MRLIGLLSLAAVHGHSCNAVGSSAALRLVAATSASRVCVRSVGFGFAPASKGGRVCRVSMAGFGSAPIPKQGAGKSRKAGGFGAATVLRKEVTKKAMASAYTRLAEEGAPSIEIFARVDPAKASAYAGSSTEPPEHGDEWLFVGRVAAGKPATLQQAAQHQVNRNLLSHNELSREPRAVRRLSGWLTGGPCV